MNSQEQDKMVFQLKQTKVAEFSGKKLDKTKFLFIYLFCSSPS